MTGLAAFTAIFERENLIAREGSIIDARWTKKNNQSYYGYKNHAKVDLKSKLIIKSETTSAEVINAQEYLMCKDNRNNPLSEEELRTNHTISRMRVRVEHVFGRMAHMGADIYRSIGLKRATSHSHLCNLTYNMDRYALLGG